jgi:hypothetical protein
MKISKLLLSLLLVVCFSSYGYAQQLCNSELSDSLGPGAGSVPAGTVINYTISLSIPASDPPPAIPNCSYENVRVYFFPPGVLGASDLPCDNLGLGTLLDSGFGLTPGGAAWTGDSGTYPIMQYTTSITDVGTPIIAKLATVFDIVGGLDDECDQKSSIITVLPPEPCLEITKSVDCEVSKVGDDVVYTICIENCGETDIYFGPGDILDTVLGDISEAFAFPNEWPDGDCPEITLPGVIPAGVVCCLDFPYTILEGDDTGEPGAILTNQVSFDGEDEYEQDVSEVSNEVDVLLVHPDWILTKDCRTDPLEVGDTAIFDVYAENTGDVCLHFDLTELSLPLIFDLAPGETYEAETNILVETEEDVTNTIVGTVTLLYGPDETCGEPDDCLPNEYEVEASDTCEVGGGATRTPGYWKTHSYMAECMFDECYPDGIDFGWTYVEDIADLMAVFHAKKAKLNKICQARLQLSFHMGAAILNDCLPNGLPFESHTGETFAGLAAIMAGCDVKAITDKIGIVGGYNEYGDDVEIIWPGDLCDDLTAYNATPAVSKEWASTVDMDDLMEDCQDCMDEKVTGKGKGPK